MAQRGAIAAGHAETARAGATILEQGGNAFDAALAAVCAACVAEPVLSSFGGGGFLLAHPGQGQLRGRTAVYDFFTQTPKRRRAESEVDFFPIVADFGEATQEFHIGMGSIAVPGLVKGLFRAHRDLGSMPMADILAPAMDMARRGVPLNRLHTFIMGVVGPILVSRAASRAVFGHPDDPARTLDEGGVPALAILADTFDALAHEGEDLFYRGEIGARLAADCTAGGGHLTRADLEGYTVEPRAPLEVEFNGARCATNPPPSTGGILIAFALELLRGLDLRRDGFGTAAYLDRLARVMELTNRARVESRLHEAEAGRAAETLLDPGFLRQYRDGVAGRPFAPRGTTHISVIDRHGNAAALSVSNGEGCGYLIPGTGIMMNNMLGEEDINPHGFHRWPTDARMCSMMSPTLMQERDGTLTVLGSGGSNRIRTAVMQVLLNLAAFGMGAEDAVAAPRIHFENGVLNVERGVGEGPLRDLAALRDDVTPWDDGNLFFGGVHAARLHPRGGAFEGGGDPRRGGVALVV
ncbi:MAG: gamma-glutamyltransferase [Hyphomicrobiales bacterium]|nr:gamma-glutamyltransferase [Hyphomicrobiales bacterium]MCP5370780.1 gamma-glutamyltransferase [Hyphomicrobiales bacterium]